MDWFKMEDIFASIYQLKVRFEINPMQFFFKGTCLFDGFKKSIFLHFLKV